jgi:hypothetical protein
MGIRLYRMQVDIKQPQHPGHPEEVEAATRMVCGQHPEGAPLSPSAALTAYKITGTQASFAAGNANIRKTEPQPTRPDVAILHMQHSSLQTGCASEACPTQSRAYEAGVFRASTLSSRAPKLLCFPFP